MPLRDIFLTEGRIKAKLVKMSGKVKIAPSILSADFTCLAEELKAVEQAGADLIHIDVMDGHFVPNITFGPLIVEACRRATALPLDVHLMIESPEKYIDNFVQAGADWLTVHLEACPHLHRTLEQIRQAGEKQGRKIFAGVSLNPATSLNLLDEILPFSDLVLIMSVNPGFGGQEFIPSSLEKIRRLKKMIQERNLEVLIEVDGGVNPRNAPDLISAGVDVLVAGSAVFKSPDYQKTISLLRG